MARDGTWHDPPGGSTQSVIARLEDADYGGHSLTMLRRIAEAIGYDVEVRFVKHVAA